MQTDRTFGILLFAGALTALWLYNTGRLDSIVNAVKSPGAKPAAQPSQPYKPPAETKPNDPGAPQPDTSVPFVFSLQESHPLSSTLGVLTYG